MDGARRFAVKVECPRWVEVGFVPIARTGAPDAARPLPPIGVLAHLESEVVPMSELSKRTEEQVHAESVRAATAARGDCRWRLWRDSCGEGAGASAGGCDGAGPAQPSHCFSRCCTRWRWRCCRRRILRSRSGRFCASQANTEVLMDEVVGIDVAAAGASRWPAGRR